MDKYKPEICCPFNKKLCIEKQRFFEHWKDAVESCANNKKTYLFHTSEKMFNNCPNGYVVLCNKFTQKQI